MPVILQIILALPKLITLIREISEANKKLKEQKSTAQDIIDKHKLQ